MEQLPEAEEYETDAYKVYEWLPADRHVVRKYGAVNRNEGIHSLLRDRCIALKRRSKFLVRSVLNLSFYISLIAVHWRFI